MASCNIVSLQEMLKLLPSLQLVFRVKVLFLVNSFLRKTTTMCPCSHVIQWRTFKARMQIICLRDQRLESAGFFLTSLNLSLQYFVDCKVTNDTERNAANRHGCLFRLKGSFLVCVFVLIWCSLMVTEFNFQIPLLNFLFEIFDLKPIMLLVAPV